MIKKTWPACYNYLVNFVKKLRKGLFLPVLLFVYHITIKEQREKEILFILCSGTSTLENHDHPMHPSCSQYHGFAALFEDS